ncbi:MAG TPA: DUF2934 domain-containing protein [Planctomycetota bacterium]|nr:DUF2934 domain-containing protein [Planctomycetota bacterium]
MSNKQPGQVHQEHTPQTGQEHGHVRQVQERERHDPNHLGYEEHRPGQIGTNEPHTTPIKALGKKSGVTIYIDHNPYHADMEKLTVAELRKLANPPIGPDKNLFRVVSGKGDDIQLDDADVIAVNMREANEGRHFFSDTIVPSKDAVARRAYYIYLEQGSQPGHDAENWAKAEAQIDSRPKE